MTAGVELSTAGVGQGSSLLLAQDGKRYGELSEAGDRVLGSGMSIDLQTETAAELDAMLPSILDKAFRGEL